MEVDQVEQEKRRGRPNKSNSNPKNATTTTTNNNNTYKKTRALDGIEDSTFAAQAEESNSTFDTWMN